MTDAPVTRFDHYEVLAPLGKGGSFAQWQSDGKELFYLSGGKLLAVEVKPGSSFEAGVPKALFDLAPLRMGSGNYAVTADGQRFLFIASAPGTQLLPFAIILD